MFGLLRLPKHGVDDEARDAFKAHYCTGCHALAAHGGASASLFTSYDQAFALLILGGLLGEAQPLPTVRRPCTGLPLKKVDVRVLPRRVARAVASLALCLADAKLQDDAHDDGRWWTRMLQRVYRRRVVRAWRVLERAGFDGHALRALPRRQALVETRSGVALEASSAPTSAVTAEVFAFLARLGGRPDLALRLGALGAELGRAIYVVDAWVDRAKDRARGRFNAIDAAGDAVDVTTWVTPRLAAVRAHLAALPLGTGEREACDGALDGLAARVPRAPCRHARGDRYAQAGDCDVCCVGAECLDGCAFCDCGGYACDLPCELFSKKRDEDLKERMRQRREKRTERRKEDLDERMKRREERKIRKRK